MWNESRTRCVGLPYYDAMSRVLVLTHAEVERLLPMAACIDLMAEALSELARGRAHMPLRLVFRPPGAAGLVALMPAYRSGVTAAFGVKTIGIFPGNVDRGLDAHQGSMMLFDGETGELRALMNAAAVTAIRTAGVSAVATRVLAREDAGDLAVLGSSVQARSHLEAMAAVRALRRVRVASRRLERAQAFAREARAPCPVEAVATAEEAVRGADLVVTATSAAEPVVRRDWIARRDAPERGRRQPARPPRSRRSDDRGGARLRGPTRIGRKRGGRLWPGRP